MIINEVNPECETFYEQRLCKTDLSTIIDVDTDSHSDNCIWCSAQRVRHQMFTERSSITQKIAELV